MNKLIITDRFDTTIKVADKFNALDDLHISLTVNNDLMSIPIFLRKDQVTELINHLQNVIENDLWRCVENSLTKKQKRNEQRN
jgi:hypothetical protein